MTFRLLVLDLDGTVMTREMTISERVVDAIDRARQQGIIVTIATGRVYNSAVQYLPQLGIREPIITFQGALVSDPATGEVIHVAGLHGETAAAVIRRLKQLGVYTIAFHGEHAMVERTAPELDLYLSFHPGGEADVRLVPDLAEFVTQENPIKLLFATNPDDLDSIVAQLGDEFAGLASVLRSHEFFGEVTAAGVHKGTAIARLAEHLGVPREQVIALGDEENDLAMIEWAGLGLAMATAPESVTSRADAVVPSIHEDGVAWAIERYLLNGRVG